MLWDAKLAGLRKQACDRSSKLCTSFAAESPTLVMGQVLKAYLHLTGTEPAALPVARKAYEIARLLPANDRERRHLEAIRLLNEGRWRAACLVLEDLTIDYPLDGLGLQAGHLIDFFTGDSRMLRDQLEPRDGWGQHAFAHVMEMQSRRRDGISWMRQNREAWSRDSFFAVHNWWHLALFHLGLDEIDQVLALFDGPIHGTTSQVILETIDASCIERAKVEGEVAVLSAASLEVQT